MKTSEVILDPWQREILSHDGNVLLCTGRQVGKTTIFAIKAAEYLVKHQKHQIIIVSLTEDQAKLIIVMILDYLEKKYKSSIATGKNKPTQNKIYLKNGASAIARPVGTTGDAVRGFTGNVLIIDEASRMPGLVWAASKPTLLTTAGQIWICSTPHGKQGYFWEVFKNKDLESSRFKVFHINSEEVVTKREISEAWTERKRKEAIAFLEQERRDMSALEYGQEYLGLFLDDLQRFFDDNLIKQACKGERPQKNKVHGKNYLGCDLARMGDDLSTFEIVNDDGGKVYRHIESMTTKKTLTTETEDRIQQIAESWSVKKIGIDAGAGTLGVSILDHLLKTKWRNKVIAINNRAISLDNNDEKKQRLIKEDLYYNLKSMMEHGEIVLLDDDEVIMSLASVQFEIVKAKSGISKVRIFGNDTHITEGIIRAAWLAKKEKSLNLFAY